MAQDNLCSNVKVTLGGTVLVDWSHLSEFEPRLPSHDRNVQVVGALRASHKRNIGRGNIANTLLFSRVEKHANHSLALYYSLALPKSWPTTAGTLEVEIRGPADPAATLYKIDYADAVIQSVSNGRAEQMFSYHQIRILAGAATLTTAPS